MSEKATNIHPIWDKMLQRTDKENLLNQKALCIWMTGLSGSGKSTIAIGLEKKLYQAGIICKVLDGDNIRSGLNSNLGFSEDDRMENIRRIAEVNKLFLENGIITINCFVSPTKDVRALAKNIIGEKDFNEIYIKASFEACTDRDVKGLYKKALAGEIKNFTGLDAPFDIPEFPDLTIDTQSLDIDNSIQNAFDFVIKKIKN
jgi:adenylylsulfate kinase